MSSHSVLLDDEENVTIDNSNKKTETFVVIRGSSIISIHISDGAMYCNVICNLTIEPRDNSTELVFISHCRLSGAAGDADGHLSHLHHLPRLHLGLLLH